MLGQGGNMMEDSVDPSHVHVLSFLTADERNEIPDAIRTKVAVNFEELTRKVHKDRIAYEGQVRTMEGQLKELRDASNTANDQLNKERKTSEEYVEKYRSSLATINQMEFSHLSLQSSFKEASLKLETLTAEKDGLVTILDKRIKEIEELNDDKKNLADQLHSTTGATSNLDTYKKEITSLEEKNKQLSLTVAKLEETSQLLRNELRSTQEKWARDEVSLNSIVTERNSLRDGKSAESENLERKIVEMKLESSTAKLKLEAKAKAAVEGHEKAKTELAISASTIRTQRIEIEKLLDQVQVLTGHGNAAATLQTLQAEREQQTKELNLKIPTLEREAIASKQHISLLKSSVEEYKSLAKSLKDQIGASNDSMVEDKLRCKDDMIRDLQSRLDGIELEATQLKADKDSLMLELAQKTDSTASEITRLEREIQVGVSKLATVMEENSKLQSDLEKQQSLTREFQTKYDNEFGLHSSVVENRNEIRNELDNVRTELGNISREKISIEEELNEVKAGNEGRDKGLLEEIKGLSHLDTELDTLHTSLLDQLLSLTAQLERKRNLDVSGSGQGDLDTSYNTSFTDASFIEDEEKSRSTEHWVQLLRYMRRQKEISYSKVEASASTVARLKSQFEYAERQYKKLEEKYNQLQSQSQKSLITSSITASKLEVELLRKIETLSALTDSNRVLCEERESLTHQLETLKVKFGETESRIEPLNTRLSSLEANVETLTTENTELKQDIGLWRARANALIEKNNKFNPEEMKKVMAEKDSLMKQLEATEEVRKKLYTENVRMDSALKTSQTAVAQLQASVQSTSEQSRKMAEDLKRVNDYKTGLPETGRFPCVLLCGLLPGTTRDSVTQHCRRYGTVKVVTEPKPTNDPRSRSVTLTSLVEFESDESAKSILRATGEETLMGGAPVYANKSFKKSLDP